MTCTRMRTGLLRMAMPATATRVCSGTNSSKEGRDVVNYHRYYGDTNTETPWNAQGRFLSAFLSAIYTLFVVLRNSHNSTQPLSNTYGLNAHALRSLHLQG